MYYILYEGLKIESNEPVYCTLYSVQYTCTLYTYMCMTLQCVCNTCIS